MAKEIKMPQLSDTMSEGKILNWSVKVGDAVSRGAVLAEVETDKANLEIECFDQGVVLAIAVEVGKVAVVGQTIAVIGEPGESFTIEAPRNGAAPKSGGASAAAVAQAPKESPAQTPREVAPAAANVAPASAQVAEGDDNSRLKISPLARKLAQEAAIDPSLVRGTGPDGRIVKRDIEEFKQSGAAAQGTPSNQPAHAEMQVPSGAQPACAAPHTPAASISRPQIVRESSTTQMSKMRDTIARRMKESVLSYPHFYCTIEVLMDNVISLREEIKADPALKAHLGAASINHFVIKSTARALSHYPVVNCSVRQENMIHNPGAINIGIVTSLGDDGLLIPVIKDADLLSLKEIAAEARSAVERARTGKPTSADLSGGTFSISNLGMFDVENFTAIINPSQGAILAVSAVQKKPVCTPCGQIVAGNVMKVTLSSDHRLIDGVTAAEFLACFKAGLEKPLLLLQ